MVTWWEAAHHVRQLVPISRWTPLVGVLGRAAGLGGGRPLVRRLGWWPPATLAALLALVAALALTLTPRG